MYATWKDEIEPVTDKFSQPARWAIERCKAIKDMLARKCRHDAIAAQVDLAIEALKEAEYHAGKPRPIRGWRLEEYR